MEKIRATTREKVQLYQVWCGTVTSVEELHDITQIHPDKKENIVH